MSQQPPKKMPVEGYRLWLARRRKLNVKGVCASVLCSRDLEGICYVGGNGLVYCARCTSHVGKRRISGLELLSYLATPPWEQT